MTQKSGLFKGQQKKTSAANRHGKGTHIRRGRVFKAPLKKTQDLEQSIEIGKFINQANEMKAAAAASKEGAQLRLVKAPVDESKPAKTKSVLSNAKHGRGSRCAVGGRD